MMYQVCVADWGPIEDSTIKDIIFNYMLWPNPIYATLEEALKAVEEEINANLDLEDEKETIKMVFRRVESPQYLYKAFYEAKFDNYDEGLYVKIWEMPDVNSSTDEVGRG